MNDRGHTTAPHTEASGSPDMNCPVLGLASEVASARVIYDRLERRLFESASNVSLRMYLEAARTDALDRELAMREMIAASRASSLQGAGVQLGELLNRLSILEDEPDSDGLREAEFRAAYRLLYSAIRVVEAAGAFKVNSIAGEGFVADNIDPWKSVDDKMLSIRSLEVGIR